MNNHKAKVAILSLNFYSPDLNYACRVHSLALQHYLEMNGIDVEILDYFPIHYDPKYDLRHPLKYFKKYPDSNKEKQKNHINRWASLYKERELRYDKTLRFVEEYTQKTNIRYNVKMLDCFDPGFDIYIAATDVIWKYRENKGFDKAFFLQSECMKGKGTIAYSVSSSSVYDAEKLAQVSDLIRDIDYISVREKWLADALEQITNKNISIAIDPVFLCPVSFYESILKEPEEKQYVLAYNACANARTIIDKAARYAKEKGLPLIELSPYKENENYPQGTSHKVIYEAGVDEWLGYIRNAECVFTNSFHCSCFSIIFNKNFYAGERGGAKIPWLLEIFHLKDRWINSDYDISRCKEDIDYDKVNALKEEYVKISGNYILNAIRSLESQMLNKETNRNIEMVLAPSKRTINIIYNSTPKGNKISPDFYDKSFLKGKLKLTTSGAMEYSESQNIARKDYIVRSCPFDNKGFEFIGWLVRAREKTSDEWRFWCNDDIWRTKNSIEDKDNMIIIKPNAVLPLSQFKQYKSVVFVAKWSKKTSPNKNESFNLEIPRKEERTDGFLG